VKANAGTVHEQSAIDFFTKLLEEKDQLISHLKTQNDVLLVCEGGLNHIVKLSSIE